MFGVLAFGIAFLILFLFTPFGFIFTFIGMRKLAKIQNKSRLKYWLFGAIPGLFLWIIVLFSYYDSPAGAPSAEQFSNFLKWFSLAAMLPGIMLLTGGLSQIIGVLIKREQE